jgi:hypothetical protein
MILPQRHRSLPGKDTIGAFKHAKRPCQSHEHGSGAAGTGLDRASATFPSGNRADAAMIIRYRFL